MTVQTLEKIGKKEYVSLLLLSIGSKLADSTPALILKKTATSGWMVPLFGLIVTLPFFYLSCKVMEKMGDVSLIDACYKVFGRHFGFLVNFALFLVPFSILVIDMRAYVDTLAAMYYPETPNFILLLVFLLFCYFIANRGLRSLGAVTYITTPFIKVTLLIFAVLIVSSSQWVNMFPLFGTGIMPLIKESFYKSSMYGDIFLLLVVYPYIQKKNLLRTTVFTTIFLCAEIMFYMIAYMILFGFPIISEVTYPFHEASKYIGFGQLASHVETYFMFFWLLAAILRFSFYLYTTALLLGHMLRIREFEPMITPVTVNVLVLGMLIRNPALNIMYIREALFAASSFLLPIFSVLFWTVQRIRGVTAREASS